MFPCLRHAVEHGQQLPHTGGESQFLRLPGRQKPLVELSNDWVSACRHQGSHIQHGAHSGPSAPGSTPPSVASAISTEWGHADQSCDLLPPYGAQLRQVGQQCHRHLVSHAGDAAQEFIFFALHWTAEHRLSKFAVQIAQLLLQPSDVGLDTSTHFSQCATQTIVLCHQHSDYLTPTGQHRSEDLSVNIT